MNIEFFYLQGLEVETKRLKLWPCSLDTQNLLKKIVWLCMYKAQKIGQSDRL